MGCGLCPITAYLTSQSATVVSSLQVANVLQSKNLSEILTPFNVVTFLADHQLEEADRGQYG